MGNIDLFVLGIWIRVEKCVFVIFGIVVLVWIFRFFWIVWIGISMISDSIIVVVGVVVMFFINSGNDNGEVDEKGNNDKLFDWKIVNDILWGMLLLFVGGICIVKVFMLLGLSVFMGLWLIGFVILLVLLLVLGICLFVIFFMEIILNIVIFILLMLILVVVGLVVGVDFKLFMILVVISVSCVFMLFVVIVFNVIVYFMEKFDIKIMVREGIMLNLLVVLVVIVVCYVILV